MKTVGEETCVVYFCPLVGSTVPYSSGVQQVRW